MAKARSLASTYAISLVILGLAFAGSLGLAIFLYVKSEAAISQAEKAQAELAKTLANEDRNKPVVVQAKVAMDVNKLSLVGSLAKSVDDLMLQVKAKEEEVKDQKSAILQGESGVKQRTAELASAQAELDSVKKSCNAKVKLAEENANQDKQSVVKARAELQAKIQGADNDVKAAQAALKTSLEDQQKNLTQKDQVVTDKEKEIADLRKVIEDLNRRIRAAHLPIAMDVATPVGMIVSVLPANEFILNIGSVEHVRPGFTFEVFPKDTIVRLGGNGDTLVTGGKATVEVYSVQEHACVARLVRGAKGTQFFNGDILVNLAYHPYTQQNFVVYGSFDINNSHKGAGSPEDEARIKALIGAAGGNVFEIDSNDVNVQIPSDVDYLVIGAEPKVPTDLSEDDKTDVTKVEAYKKAKKIAEVFGSLKNQARQMQIPILNQNRFLALTGFYNRNKVSSKTAVSN